ncbi:MAG TPA: hypothetical protein VEI07_19830 [Planctomycetaceae bacterium]|nr:hypothetical protein [Planctomycetaceae bacterium]
MKIEGVERAVLLGQTRLRSIRILRAKTPASGPGSREFLTTGRRDHILSGADV